MGHPVRKPSTTEASQPPSRPGDAVHAPAPPSEPSRLEPPVHEQPLSHEDSQQAVAAWKASLGKGVDRQLRASAPPPPQPLPTQQLPGCEFLIVSGIPLGDAGGGQRSAQLARAFAHRFCTVHFVYIFPSASFENQGTTFVTGVSGLAVQQMQLSPAVATDLVPSLSRGARVIIEVPHRDVIPVVEAARRHKTQVVVEILDDWFDKALGGDWFNKADLVRILNSADRVVATALALQRQAQAYFAWQVEYLPNAANELEFRPAAFREAELALPGDWPPGASRVALYFGSLYGSWLRWDFIHEAAKVCPDTEFVIIGDASQQVKDMNKDFRNVHLIGLKQHSELTAYVQAATVGLLPFAPGPLLETISPVKVFEYGFAGLPVVATFSEELKGLPFIHQAKDARQFASLACSELPAPSSDDLSTTLQQYSWGRVADAMMQDHKLQHAFVVIILCHNNGDFIGRMVRSALKHGATKTTMQVIVVDTASTDESPQVLADLKAELGITVVQIDSPGCSAGRNAGLAAINLPGFVPSRVLVSFFDSDMLITSASWMYETEAIHLSNPRLGAIGWAAGWFNPDLPYDTVVYGLPRRGANSETDKLGFRVSVGYLGSGGMVAKLSALMDTSGFDERFFPAGFEDTDLSFALREAGYFIAYREFGGVLHEAHKTTARIHSEAKLDYDDLLRKNGKLFRSKWKNRPQYFSAG